MREETYHDDEQLVLCLKQGDKEAFHALYQKYVSRLYYHVLKFAKSPETDIDITINLLRERIGMILIHIDQLNAQGLDLREEVRQEHRVELALKGTCYFDILRWEQRELLAQDVKGIKAEFIPSEENVSDIPAGPEGYIIVEDNRTFDAPKN